MTENHQTTPAMLRKGEEFYLVWSPQGGEPMKRHINFRSADKECYRLHALHPESEFYVLKAKKLHPAAPLPPTPEVV